MLHVFADHTQKVEKPLGLIAIRSDRDGNVFNEFSANIDIEEMGHFMLDGVAFLMMRYLASLRFTGVVETFSMYLSGMI